MVVDKGHRHLYFLDSFTAENSKGASGSNLDGLQEQLQGPGLFRTAGGKCGALSSQAASLLAGPWSSLVQATPSIPTHIRKGKILWFTLWACTRPLAPC